MTDSNPRNYVHAEVLGGVQRRRRWTPEEKLRMVEETFLSGNSVSSVARIHGVAPNQLFGWRRQAASGALTATRAGGEVVPASEYRALENQVRELQRMLGKKTMENEILREAISRVAGPKTYGPPRLQAAIFDDMISLHKRIRHVGALATAKMEIRASSSS